MDAATIRLQACRELGFLQQRAREAVPALTVALKDPSPEVQLAALRALGEIGPAAGSATPVLLRLLADPAYLHQAGAPPGISLRGDVFTALVAISPDDPRVRQTLLRELHGENGLGRGTSAWAISRLGLRPQSAPFLLTALGEADPSDQATIIRALATCKPRPAEAIPILANVLAGEDYSAVLAAAEVLGEYASRNPSAGSTLIERLARLRDPASRDKPLYFSLDRGNGTVRVPVTRDASLRSALITALGKSGPGAAAAIPLLQAEIEDGQNKLRFRAAFSRAQIDGKWDELSPILEGGLRHETFEVRKLAFECVKELPAACQDRGRLLAIALADPEPKIRWEAVQGVAALRLSDSWVRDALKPLIYDPKFSIRLAARGALGKMDPLEGRRFSRGQ